MQESENLSKAAAAKADDKMPAAAAQNHAPSALSKLIGRAVLRRCLVCGRGVLFRGWLRMPKYCSVCGYRFERGPGYWLGSIYINYGLTALLVTIAYFVLFFTEALPQVAVLWVLAAFCFVFPLWFFPYARALWMAFDLYFDPVREDKEFENSRSNR